MRLYEHLHDSMELWFGLARNSSVDLLRDVRRELSGRAENGSSAEWIAQELASAVGLLEDQMRSLEGALVPRGRDLPEGGAQAVSMLVNKARPLRLFFLVACFFSRE